MSAMDSVHTRFGTVSDSQTTVVTRGWLRRRQRTIPLDQIASVRQDVQRFTGIGLGLLLLASLAYPSLPQPASVVATTLFSLAGALLLWGSPVIVITTTGGYTRRLIGFPGSFAEADRYVASLRRALFEASHQPSTGKA